jgi:mono/diheme cytochrome c family protein
MTSPHRSRRLRAHAHTASTLALIGLASLLGLVADLTRAEAPTSASSAPSATPLRPSDRSPVDLGRYLVKTTGCNDCHTAGYSQSAGATAEAQWLTGDSLGWHGPWGTTYATNLRLSMARFTQAQWLAYARQLQARPPMPWFALRQMSDTDLAAIYQYVRAAGPAGEPAPAALPPGQKPTGPVVLFPAPPQ